MKIKIILVLIIITVCFNLNAKIINDLSDDSDDLSYSISLYSKNSGNKIDLNKYLFVHYVYMDVLYIFDIHRKFGIEEKIDILDYIYKLLSGGGIVHFIVKEYDDENDLKISFSIISSDDKDFLFLISNYDFENDKLVFTEDELKTKAYAKGYFIFQEKLVNSHNLFSEEKESKYKENNNLNNLADLYIFDEVNENDEHIENILYKSIDESETIEYKFISTLTLVQYYLSIDDINKAFEFLNKANSLLEKEEFKGKEYWNEIYSLSYDEFLITKELNWQL